MLSDNTLGEQANFVQEMLVDARRQMRLVEPILQARTPSACLHSADGVHMSVSSRLIAVARRVQLLKGRSVQS